MAPPSHMEMHVKPPPRGLPSHLLPAHPGPPCTQAMSEARSALVCNDALATACVASGLRPLIKLGSPGLARSVESYCRGGGGGRPSAQPAAANGSAAGAAADGSGGDDDGGGDGSSGGSGGAPKVLADVVEALVGAVYLDSRGDLYQTEQVGWCGRLRNRPYARK